MSQTESQMPERYRPDPWADADVYSDNTGRLRCRIPTPALQWVEAAVGDVLFAAPKSPSAVTIGYTVPDILGEMLIHSKYNGKTPFRRLPSWINTYLDISEGDTIRFHKIDDDRFRAELLGADDE